LKELCRPGICFFLRSSITLSTVGSVSIYDDGPRIVIWEMTRACALACTHCRAKALPRRDARELTTCEAFDLVDEVAAYGRPIFVLTGGEPVERPDLFEIVSYAAQRELRVAVSPSGTARLTKSALERVAATGCRRMALSIDGSDAVIPRCSAGGRRMSRPRANPSWYGMPLRLATFAETGDKRAPDPACSLSDAEIAKDAEIVLV
jgi:hypothetical protein